MEDAVPGRRCGGLNEAQSSVGQKCGVLGFCSLAAMEEEHHREIEKAHFRRQPVRWSDHLYEQDRCAIIHGFAAVLQDFRCRCVVPIVNYELQDVRVPTRWHGLEKVARDLSHDRHEQSR